jgi:hypothetical protein
LALYANFVHLTVATMLSDEPVYMHAAWRYLHSQTGPLHKLANGSWYVALPDNYEHPPLAKYLFGIAQIVVGQETVAADRAVAAACTLLTGALLFWWLSRVANRWVGLLTFLMVTLMPQHGLIVDTFSRYGVLEPVAALFMVASLIAGWYWFASESAGWSWLLAATTGVAAGLAASAKESGFLGIVVPVLFGLALVFARERGLVLVRLTQAASAAITAGLVCFAMYLPIGSPVLIVRYMFDYQSTHYSGGHPIELAGHVHALAPWWATLRYAYDGLGTVLTITLTVLALVAIGLRRDRLIGWLVASLVAPIVFLCFINTFSLAFYWTLWASPFYALAALGIGELLRLASGRDRRGAWAPGLAAMAAIVIALAAFGQMIAGVAQLQPRGDKVVAQTVQRLGLGKDQGLLLDVPVVIMREYLPQKLLLTAIPPSSLSGIKWVAEVPNYCPSTDENDNVRALIALNSADDRLAVAYQDSGVRLYRVTAPLLMPTPADVTVVPPAAARCPNG